MEARENEEAITAVVADDHEVVRNGIKLILESQLDVDVVAEAGDVQSAGECVAGHSPALLLLDLNMPGGSSLDLIPRIAEASPQTRTIVLTMQSEPAAAKQALSSGARAYVLKQAAVSDLADAVQEVLAGGTFVSAELGRVA